MTPTSGVPLCIKRKMNTSFHDPHDPVLDELTSKGFNKRVRSQVRPEECHEALMLLESDELLQLDTVVQVTTPVGHRASSWRTLNTYIRRRPARDAPVDIENETIAYLQADISSLKIALAECKDEIRVLRTNNAEVKKANVELQVELGNMRRELDLMKGTNVGPQKENDCLHFSNDIMIVGILVRIALQESNLRKVELQTLYKMRGARNAIAHRTNSSDLLMSFNRILSRREFIPAYSVLYGAFKNTIDKDETFEELEEAVKANPMFLIIESEVLARFE